MLKSLKAKLMFYGTVLTLVPILSIFIISIWQINKSSNISFEECVKHAGTNLELILEGVHNMVCIQH